MTATELTRAWSPSDRWRISGVLATIALLHVGGVVLYLSYIHRPGSASAFAGAGVLAYTLGVRHAFDADHIAAIDDTTRLMVYQGRRPVGVGFFFAMGHSSVVIAMSMIIAAASGAADGTGLTHLRHLGSIVSTLVAAGFLSLVAVLNALVLRAMVGLWRRARAGWIDEDELTAALLNRGLVNRILGPRAQLLIKSSWHMYPLGILFGLGLETASEVALLTLSATTARAGAVPLAATLSLPLLFAAGMSAFDTCDGLLMSRAYAWSQDSPTRRLFYNLVTTSLTVVVAGFVASVCLAGVLTELFAVAVLRPYAAIGQHFQALGFGVVGIFLVGWLGAAIVWRRIRGEL